MTFSNPVTEAGSAVHGDPRKLKRTAKASLHPRGRHETRRTSLSQHHVCSRVEEAVPQSHSGMCALWGLYMCVKRAGKTGNQFRMTSLAVMLLTDWKIRAAAISITYFNDTRTNRLFVISLICCPPVSWRMIL